MARAGPKPTRTAGATIALANQQATSAWEDRVREPSPDVKLVLADDGEPEAVGAFAEGPMDTEKGEAEPMAAAAPAVGTPRITLRIRSQAATPTASTPVPEVEPDHTRSGRPRGAAANGKKAPAKKVPAKKRATRGRKRKASEDEGESEAEESDGEDAPGAPRRNGRRSSPPPAPTGRVLRSRAAKPNLREPSSEFSAEE